MSEEHAEERIARSPVVVTGSSSGIGAASARLLAENGHKVFAGRRDIARAGEPEGVGAGSVIPLALDVTNDESVARALAVVEAGIGPAGRLSGVVNNAGITVNGPAELVSMEDLREQFEVNLVGAARVSQAFLPLLRRSGGRIVNIGSLTARMSFPFAGPYSASKAALAAMSHAMRRELRPHGVHVVLLEPGNIQTGIWDKHIRSVQSLLDRATPDARRAYEHHLKADVRMVGRLKAGGTDPREVASAVLEALNSERPRSRYAVGLDSKALSALLRVMPSPISDRLIARFMGVR
ncbi:SDR family oxidoreductase [Rubrobacter tropicus]|uniref:SDR family oxidoreductase n=1 Tax=Rubrobacter tropicus TaxID=2653851 RepID=UPI0014076880|nr:SDR family oxidoreductase [Rubrobacter tropicus]